MLSRVFGALTKGELAIWELLSNSYGWRVGLLVGILAFSSPATKKSELRVVLLSRSILDSRSITSLLLLSTLLLFLFGRVLFLLAILSIFFALLFSSFLLFLLRNSCLLSVPRSGGNFLTFSSLLLLVLLFLLLFLFLYAASTCKFDSLRYIFIHHPELKMPNGHVHRGSHLK